MSWKISSKCQILFLSSIGICRTITEYYSHPFASNLETVWEMKLAEGLNSYDNFIKTVISAVHLIRGFTGHLYIASYFLILYPLFMGKCRSILLIWLFLAGLRSIILDTGVSLVGFLICASAQEMNKHCLEFAITKAFDLGFSLFMWTTINDFYHSLKRSSLRNRMQPPFNSPVTSDQFVVETSSSILSEEWSLPASLVEEFHKSTQENILEGDVGAEESVKNLTSRSMDDLLAQAMVEWFIKKIFKFKPKGDDRDSTEKPPGLTNLRPSDISELKTRIKKSIADINEEEIMNIMISDNNNNQSEDNDRTDQTDESNKLSRTDCNSQQPENISNYKTDNSIYENVIELDENSQMLSIIPEGVTCRSNNVDKIPDFSVNDMKNSSLDLNVANCYLENKSKNNSPAFNKGSDKQFNFDDITIEPSKAISLVKCLFNEDIEESIQKTINDSITLTRINDELQNNCVLFDNSKIDFCENSRQKVSASNDSNENSSNSIKDESDCSFVKSILGDIIDGVTSGSRRGILKNKMTIYNSEGYSETELNSKTSRNPLKETNMNSRGAKNVRISKKITFLEQNRDSLLTNNPRKNPDYNKYTDELPELVVNVLRDVNTDAITKGNGLMNRLHNPNNKENETEAERIVIAKNLLKFDEKLNRSANNVKSLRYHYRRINPVKVLKKRQKQTTLSQESLMSILKDITRNNDKKQITFIEKPDRSIEHISKSMVIPKYDPKFRRINSIKDTSSQTITTKTLLKKIKEIEQS